MRRGGGLTYTTAIQTFIHDFVLKIHEK